METNASFDSRSRSVHEYSDMRRREYCEMLNGPNDEIAQLNRHSTHREYIEMDDMPSEHQYERVRYSTIEQNEDKSKANLGMINQILKMIFVCVIIVAAVLLCVMIVIVILNMLGEHKDLTKVSNFNNKSGSSTTIPTSSSTVASRQTVVSKSDSTIVSTTTRTVFPKKNHKTENELNVKREFVKEMMLGSWNAYVRYAWGHAALKPVSKTSSPSSSYFEFGKNSGFTLVNSMSTLWIMGLKYEFEQGKKWIENELDLSKLDKEALVYEVATVYVGSLLSCYALTNKSTFLHKALEIAQLVQPAFNTPTGIPYEDIRLKSGKGSNDPYLSYLGGYQLDFNYLSDASGNSKFRNQILHIQNAINKVENHNMKYSCKMNVNEGHFDCLGMDLFFSNKDLFTNLIKSYIQSNHRDVQSLEMYKEALDQMDAVKMFGLSPGGLHYATRYYTNGTVDKFMEYSGCNLGAMLALGATAMQQALVRNSSTGENQKNKELNRIDRHRMLAEKLTETCHVASNHTRTGLGPASFVFNKTEGFAITNSVFYLRPAFAESNFVLWRLTHNPKYRDYAWEMAQAIKQFCRVESGGYSGIENVDQIPTLKNDNQAPHFLSATLKYLYLTFTDDDVLPLDQWVFNTQGHPLPICGKNPVYPENLCKF